MEEIIKQAGSTYHGIQVNPYGEDLVLFDNEAGSTLALPISQVTLENVKKKLNDSDLIFLLKCVNIGV